MALAASSLTDSIEGTEYLIHGRYCLEPLDSHCVRQLALAVRKVVAKWFYDTFKGAIIAVRGHNV